MANSRISSGFDRFSSAKPSVTIALAFISMAIALLAPPDGAGANEPFRIAFDENEIRIGPIGGLPVGQIDGSSSIEGTVDPQGRVTIPKGGFRLPVLGIDEPVKVRGFMGIEEAATGEWDPATGKLEINAKAGLWLSIDVAATLGALQGLGVDLGGLGALGPIIGALAGDLTCGFSPMDVTFTTETTSLGSGQRFTRGLDGPGALTAEWSKLGRFAGKTKVFGFIDACSALRTFAPSLISGLAGSAIPGFDLGGIDIAGLLNNLDNLDLGPSALTISRTTDESGPVGPPEPARLAVSAARTTVRARAGKPVRIPVRITNSGDLPASGVTVCPRMSKGSRTRGKCVEVGTIGPARTVTPSLTLTPQRSRKAARSGKKKRRAARTRSVRVRIVVAGANLPVDTRSLILRVIG